MSVITALNTGFTGQGSANLAESLLKEESYKIHGIERCPSALNTASEHTVYVDPNSEDARFLMLYGDLTSLTDEVVFLVFAKSV